MKHFIKLLSIAGTIVLFTACGGGGSGGGTAATSSGTGSTATTTDGTATTPTNSATITTMQLNQPMPIYDGTEVINSSEDSKIKILVIGNEKTATLLSGTADLKTP